MWCNTIVVITQTIGYVIYQELLDQTKLELEFKGKYVFPCCTVKSGIWPEISSQRTSTLMEAGKQRLFSASAAADLIWALVPRFCHLSTHSPYSSPNDLCLSAFRFVTWIWVIYVFGDSKPSLFTKQRNFEVNSSRSRQKE